MQPMRTCGTCRSNYVDGKRWKHIDNQYIEEAKSKDEELDGGRTRWGGRRNATDVMDKLLPVITRIWD